MDTKPDSKKLKQASSKANNNLYIIIVIILLFFSAIPSWAQSESEIEKKWNFTIAPYILLPYMNGDVAVKGIPISVSSSPNDIFDNLNWGVMLHFEASNDQLVIFFDGLYMDLGKKGTTPLTNRDAEVSLEQLGFSLYGMYRLNSWADIGIGGRVNSIGSSVRIAAGDYILPGRDFSMNETWFDPLLVARVNTQFNESNWRLGMLADIGGFGMGSDLTWQINPYGGYQFSKLFEINLAYRWLDIKYETGSETERFLYDMTTSGPEVRLLFHF